MEKIPLKEEIFYGLVTCQLPYRDILLVSLVTALGYGSFQQFFLLLGHRVTGRNCGLDIYYIQFNSFQRKVFWKYDLVLMIGTGEMSVRSRNHQRGWLPLVLFDSLQPHGLQPIRLFCPWDFPGKNTGVGCHFLLQGIFLDPGIEPGSLALQADSLLSGKGKRNPFLPVTYSYDWFYSFLLLSNLIC